MHSILLWLHVVYCMLIKSVHKLPNMVRVSVLTDLLLHVVTVTDRYVYTVRIMQ